MKSSGKMSAISQATMLIILFMVLFSYGESSSPPPPPPLSNSKVLYKECNSKTNPNANTLINTLAKSVFSHGYGISIQGNGSDVLYGMLECRGDLDQKECLACSSMVAYHLKNHCPNSSTAWIQVEGCYLRYDKHPFFWKHHDFFELYHQCGGMGYSTGPDFNDVLEEVVYKAPIHDGFYAASTSDVTYALAQCNAYLGSYDCGICLRVALYILEFDCLSPDYMFYVEEAGSRILLDSCLLRFEKHKFFKQQEKGDWWNTEFPSAPRRKIHKLVIAITCGVVGGSVFALCLLGIYIKIKARRRLLKVHCIAQDGEVPRLSNEPTNVAVTNPRPP